MDPWYKIATPRKEVREGRSFNPDEFAIHLEQVVAGTAPEDYRDPDQFFARTSFTRALREHSGMVLRRLAGETANTTPVMTLVTQFGGGKTHTLTALYHITTAGKKVSEMEGVAGLLKEAGLSEAPQAKVAAFVGNAWDPLEGRETPLDRSRPAACRRQGCGGARSRCKEGAAGYRGARPRLRRRGRPGADPLRRGAQLRQPASRVLRALPRLHPESDGGDDGHHPRGGHHQPPAQPGGDDRLRPRVAGQDHQGGAAGRQGPYRQRRDRDQRGGAAASVR